MKENYVSLNIKLSDILDDKKFIIPQFQRSVVWKPKRRKDFITNLRSGDPFGVILVRRNNDRYELIDGLQRITTIRDYHDNPFDYLTADDIDIDLVKKIIYINLKELDIEPNENYIEKKSKELKVDIFNCLKGCMKSYEMIESIKEKNGFKSREISHLLDEIFTDFNQKKDLTNLSVMAIDYTGPSENIPNVFYNLNTGGVQLTKYETYAALWSKPLFKIDDELLIKYVKNKYTQIENESDLDVNFDEEDLKINGMSLFEYCYALGGVIRNEEKGFDLLFAENKKSTDPLGFEILTLILDQNVNKAEKIHEILKNAPADFLIEIKKMLENSISKLKKILEPTLLSLNKKSLSSDSNYLIYHILISYIKEYYQIDLNNWKITEAKDSLAISDLKKYLPLHYVYDCITDYWRINRQVSDLQRDINDSSKRQKYWTNIKYADWEKGVQDFIDSQKGVSKTIPQKNKLFIDFLIKMKLKKSPQYSIYFVHKNDEEVNILDFEHIVTKKVIQNHIKDLTVSQQNLFSVSNIGNLCYLAIKDNRAKREKTIYEFKEDRPSYTFNEEYLNLINYPTKEELRFLHYSNTDFREEYARFVKDRVEVLRKEFLNLIKEQY